MYLDDLAVELSEAPEVLAVLVSLHVFLQIFQ
jgi:hypothetical protein